MGGTKVQKERRWSDGRRALRFCEQNIDAGDFLVARLRGGYSMNANLSLRGYGCRFAPDSEHHRSDEDTRISAYRALMGAQRAVLRDARHAHFSTPTGRVPVILAPPRGHHLSEGGALLVEGPTAAVNRFLVLFRG